MGVSTTHPDYNDNRDIVRLVRDSVKGDPEVKKRRELYLPADFAKENGEYTDHYLGYLNRAYFLGVTGRTKEALSGMVFRKGPVMELPPQIEALMDNIDGAGQSLEQISKEMVGEVQEAGKHYLLVDFPQADKTLIESQSSAWG